MATLAPDPFVIYQLRKPSQRGGPVVAKVLRHQPNLSLANNRFARDFETTSGNIPGAPPSLDWDALSSSTATTRTSVVSSLPPPSFSQEPAHKPTPRRRAFAFGDGDDFPATTIFDDDAPATATTILGDDAPAAAIFSPAPLDVTNIAPPVSSGKKKKGRDGDWSAPHATELDVYCQCDCNCMYEELCRKHCRGPGCSVHSGKSSSRASTVPGPLPAAALVGRHVVAPPAAAPRGVDEWGLGFGGGAIVAEEPPMRSVVEKVQLRTRRLEDVGVAKVDDDLLLQPRSLDSKGRSRKAAVEDVGAVGELGERTVVRVSGVPPRRSLERNSSERRLSERTGRGDDRERRRRDGEKAERKKPKGDRARGGLDFSVNVALPRGTRVGRPLTSQPRNASMPVLMRNAGGDGKRKRSRLSFSEETIRKGAAKRKEMGQGLPAELGRGRGSGSGRKDSPPRERVRTLHAGRRTSTTQQQRRSPPPKKWREGGLFGSIKRLLSSFGMS